MGTRILTTVKNKESIYIFTNAKADKTRQCTNVKVSHYYKQHTTMKTSQIGRTKNSQKEKNTRKYTCGCSYNENMLSERLKPYC